MSRSATCRPCWLIVAVAVLGIGWLPRAAAVVAWVVVGYCAVIALFADSFNLPEWLHSAAPRSRTRRKRRWTP